MVVRIRLDGGSRFQVQQLVASGAVVRTRRNSNLQLPKQQLATSLRKRPFVRQGGAVAYRRCLCAAGRWLAPRNVLPVCTPGRWFAACWQLLHPPSKIENRRLLIKKKPAKRYEHSAGLGVEPSERRSQTRDRHKYQSTRGPNTFGCAKKPSRKHSRRIDPGKQQFRGRKRLHGASLQRFLPWLAENTTMGPLGTPRSHRKSSKKS